MYYISQDTTSIIIFTFDFYSIII